MNIRKFSIRKLGVDITYFDLYLFFAALIIGCISGAIGAFWLPIGIVVGFCLSLFAENAFFRKYLIDLSTLVEILICIIPLFVGYTLVKRV
jgi:hypothetical protein